MNSCRGWRKYRWFWVAVGVLGLMASSGFTSNQGPPPAGKVGVSRGPSSPGAAPLSLVASDSNPVYTNGAGNGLVDRLAREAFARLGISVQLGVLPSERAIKNVQEGRDDGDLLRIGGLSTKYPHLIQVPEPWLEMAFSTFTLRPDLQSPGWNDLRPLVVGIIKGWKVAEINTEGFPSVLKAKNAEQLFQLLYKKRADVIVYDALQGEYTIKRMKLHGVRRLDPPLATHEIFLYLHERHADVVGPLSETLRAMKKDGTHQRLLKEGMAELMH